MVVGGGGGIMRLGTSIGEKLHPPKVDHDYTQTTHDQRENHTVITGGIYLRRVNTLTLYQPTEKGIETKRDKYTAGKFG